MDEPAFQEPWHAQVFAITVHLHSAGVFTWPDWAAKFSETLKQHGLSKELDGGDDYFKAWLETLEVFLTEKDLATDTEILTLVGAWREAYLSTPHGEPVRISGT